MHPTREPDCAGPDIPGYRLIRMLAESQMSQVYLAEESFGEHRRVALKLLDAGVRPALIDRFRRESAIATGLRHPNIVETFHTGSSTGHHYIAMRFVDGPNLGRLIGVDGPLSFARTLAIAGPIATALDAAHASGLVHRDVKPANILLDTSGQAFLCDFGIAKDLRAMTAAGDGGGPVTPQYAAPEQQANGKVTGRADVYAFAGVLYHCLTGHPPFDRYLTQEVVRAHLRERPLPVAAVRPELPPQVDEVFQRGLAKWPSDRYASCTELVADLAAIFGGTPRPVLPPLPPWSPRSRSSARRARTVAFGLAVLVLAAVLVTGQPWRVRDVAGSPTAQVTTEGPFPTSAESALVSLIGDGGCHRAAPGETQGFVGVQAAIDCTPPGGGATSETYLRFDTVADLRGAFNQDAGAAKAPTGVSCTQGTVPGFLGNQRYDLRSVDLGGLLCHPGPNSSLVMEWSVEPLRVLGRASGTDAAGLSGWWRSYYGPPTPAIAAAVNAQSTPRVPTHQESALLAHIPPASRQNCVRPSAVQMKNNVGNVPVTGVVCGPTSGAAIVFYYQFANDTAMHTSFGAMESGGLDCTDPSNSLNGDHAYSRGGQSGWLQCLTDGHTGERDLSWTDDQSAIEGLAFQCGDPAAAIDWWENDAGPS
jgi:hypothetical protein